MQSAYLKINVTKIKRIDVNDRVKSCDELTISQWANEADSRCNGK